MQPREQRYKKRFNNANRFEVVRVLLQERGDARARERRQTLQQTSLHNKGGKNPQTD